MSTPTSPTATRTYYGVTIDRLSPGHARRYAAFTAQRWVYGDTIAEIQQAIRDTNGMGLRPNGYTYA
jgi:hypothetical protein